jgi:hypothetical protein
VEKEQQRKEQKKVTIKVWEVQGVEEYRRRLEKATFKEQYVEKMEAELKEVIEKKGRKEKWLVGQRM